MIALILVLQGKQSHCFSGNSGPLNGVSQEDLSFWANKGDNAKTFHAGATKCRLLMLITNHLQPPSSKVLSLLFDPDLLAENHSHIGLWRDLVPCWFNPSRKNERPAQQINEYDFEKFHLHCLSMLLFNMIYYDAIRWCASFSAVGTSAATNCFDSWTREHKIYQNLLFKRKSFTLYWIKSCLPFLVCLSVPASSIYT